MVLRLVNGSEVVQRRRCGKPICRCANVQEMHETAALSYSFSGRTRTLMIKASDLGAVRCLVKLYGQARANLDAEVNAGLATFITARVVSHRRSIECARLPGLNLIKSAKVRYRRVTSTAPRFRPTARWLLIWRAEFRKSITQ